MTISKQELIERIEDEIPDNAIIVCASVQFENQYGSWTYDAETNEID